MSLTPPPPPPPHRQTNLLASGCKTPNLNQTQLFQSKSNNNNNQIPSPNQLSRILSDITKQINNTTQTKINNNNLIINSFMRPSLRQTGPITRSRSMLHVINNNRSNLTPRNTRSNTPIIRSNENTPSTPFNNNNNNNNQFIFLNSISPNSLQLNHNHHSIRNSITPLRYTTLTTINNEFNLTTTPSSSISDQRTPLSINNNNHSSSSSSPPTPPLTPSSSTSSTSTSTTFQLSNQNQINRLTERRNLHDINSSIIITTSTDSSTHINNSLNDKSKSDFNSGSLAKRRKRNPSGLGRL